MINRELTAALAQYPAEAEVVLSANDQEYAIASLDLDVVPVDLQTNQPGTIVIEAGTSR